MLFSGSFATFFAIVKFTYKLLKAVHSNEQVQSYLCGYRALGSINKFVSGRLWRLFFDLSIDACTCKIFRKHKILKENVCNSLVIPSNIFDEPTR